MSSDVCAYRIDDDGSRVRVTEMMSLSPERWRWTVWGSTNVRKLVETVRRPRPSRVILPELVNCDIDVRGEELDQLGREVDVLVAHFDVLVAELDVDGERFRRSLGALRAAVEAASAVPRGGVEIG